MVNEQPSNAGNTDRVEITYFTDPLCCWSWAFEPQWRRLRFEYQGKLEWKYVMAGLLPDWKAYHDDVNAISRPAQMGPLWMQVHHISGMPIADKMWIFDPPASSYPACIAVKCAQLQSPEAGEQYLRLVRESIMIRNQNISKTPVLLSLAKMLEGILAGNFDLGRFEADLTGNAGLDAFRTDLQQVQYRNISRYPTLVIKSNNGNAVLFTGYQPYEVLEQTLLQVKPGLEKTNTHADQEGYKRFWGSVLDREYAELNRVVASATH